MSRLIQKNTTAHKQYPNCPKVTVITVCLNAEDVIEPTIKSVINQDYPYIEYLIIDGKSQDGTMDIVVHHDDCIDQIISEPDEGLYNAMNKGIRIATGDVLIFLNAGDLFAADDVLAKIAQMFINDPSVMIVYGDCLLRFSGDCLLPKKQPPKLTRWKLWMNSICHQTIFARRAVFEQIGGFDESLPICSDLDWTMRAVLIAGHPSVHLPLHVCIFQMGGVCSNRQALQLDKATIRRRYYSTLEMVVFSVLEFFYKIFIYMRIKVFSHIYRGR